MDFIELICLFNYFSCFKLAVLRYTGALGYGTADLFNEAWDTMGNLVQDYANVSMPWLDPKDTE